jgi:hypothetical protein
MSKLYLDVITPGNGKVYEFYLDSSIQTKQAKELMIELIIELEHGGITLKPEKCLLFNRDSGMYLDSGRSLYATGVRSGQTLLLL